MALCNARRSTSAFRHCVGFMGSFCSLCWPPMSLLIRGIQILEARNCGFWDNLQSDAQASNHFFNGADNCLWTLRWNVVTTIENNDVLATA